MTSESVLAGILAGDRTKQQVASRFGIDLTPISDYRDPAEEVRYRPAEALSDALTSLHCEGLLNMRVVGAGWHYLPTKQARDNATPRCPVCGAPNPFGTHCQAKKKGR
jgi:hypothetical protein